MIGNASLFILASFVFGGIVHAEVAGTVTCKDGTTATAGRGACHGHGGVAKPEQTDTSKATSSDTTVTCKDGTTSKGGRGACHGHGGVAKTPAGAPPAAAAPAPAPAAAMDTSNATSSGTTVTCKDGTTSKGGRGACHGHGGVAKTPAGAPPAAAAPAPAPAPAAGASGAATGSASTTKKGKAANTDPSGALAKCHDGMYWHGTKHSGACSRHGGVDSWLDGSQK